MIGRTLWDTVCAAESACGIVDFHARSPKVLLWLSKSCELGVWCELSIRSLSEVQGPRAS